jgi:hypothetical protein
MLISVSGLKGSGKDSVAAILVKKHSFQRVAMADILKEVVANVTGLPLYYFHDVKLKDAGLQSPLIFDEHLAANLAFELNALGIDVVPSKFESKLGVNLETPRDALIYIGTACCRNLVSEDIWLDLAMNKIKKMEGNIIVTDARFKNERQALKKLGAKLMYVDRPSVTNVFDAATADITETDQLSESYDIYVINDSTLNRLENDIGMWYTAKIRTLT